MENKDKLKKDDSNLIEEIKMDFENAVPFCTNLHSEQITLTAIGVTPKGLVTETFYTKTQSKEIAQFLKKHSDCNQYFSVNKTKTLIKIKPKKTDVEYLDMLHVDIDPTGDPTKLQEEREEILARINAYKTPPSLVIDSGNGYQAFWRLEVPIKIESIKQAEELESYNKQLAIDLGGDIPCRNVDRIMRLPGTINWPTSAKIKKGRKKVPTSLVKSNDLNYTLRDFKKAPPEDKSLNKKDNSKTAQGNLPEIDIFKLRINQNYKDLILEGEGGCYGGDRSKAVFAVCCELYRKKYDDETIENILLYKDFKISDHIYDQSQPEKYAQKQIERAKEKIEEGIRSIFKSVEALTRSSEDKEIYEILNQIKRQQFSPVKEEQTLQKIKEKTKLGIKTLREGLNKTNHPKKAVEDIGLDVAKKTLSKYFEGGKYLIRTKEGSSWEYKETHWEQTNDDFIKNRIIKTIEYEQQKNEEILGGNNFDSIAKQALSLIRAMQVIDGDPLSLREVPKPIINVMNGEIWLDENGDVDFRNHKYDSYLTYCLNVEYEPDAKCPEYDKALLRTFNNVREGTEPKEMANLWNEMMGYIIQPNRDIPAYFILYGNGCNGKTSLVEVMTNLMGKNSIHAGRIEKLESGNLFMIGSLAGKLLFLDDDVNANTKLPDGILKKISERKIMTGELKFKAHFDFVCVAVPVLLCNQYPSTSDLTHGMLRRAYVLPFDRRFTEKDMDPKLFKGIKKNELQGVLNRALEGLKRLRQKGKFNVPKACKIEKKKWLVAANPLMSFIEEQCDQGSFNEETWEYNGLDKNGNPLSQELRTFFEKYTSWCENVGIRNPITKRTLKRNLESLGYKILKSSLNRVMGLEAQEDVFI